MNNMIDIHNHIMPFVDDGSHSFEESISLLKDAYLCGVKDIVLTPHYIVDDVYCADNDYKKELLNQLNELCHTNGIDINLYIGNEIFVTNDMVSLLNSDRVSTINNSRYVLFELPMYNKYIGVDDLLFDLRYHNYFPVLAHPERYAYIEDNNEMNSLIEHGALLQCNIGSFLGYYGKSAKKKAFYLLKNRYISFICGDIHHDSSKYYKQIKKLKKSFERYVSKDYIEDIFYNNALKVLKDEDQ